MTAEIMATDKDETQWCDGLHPIHIATRSGHIKGMQEQVDQGVSVELRTNDHELDTPLILASRYSTLLDAVKWLLHHKAIVNAVDYIGASSLIRAAYAGNVDIVKTLLEFKADTTLCISHGENKGRTALEIARHFGRTDVVRVLEEVAAIAAAPPAPPAPNPFNATVAHIKPSALL